MKMRNTSANKVNHAMKGSQIDEVGSSNVSEKRTSISFQKTKI